MGYCGRNYESQGHELERLARVHVAADKYALPGLTADAGSALKDVLSDTSDDLVALLSRRSTDNDDDAKHGELSGIALSPTSSQLSSSC